ncbi:hypothetical protein Bbelb_213520 [Branchiostoma belcheri]|nr:hypothetical protein Bbelb_213520 [Branchiostoma belcheri]
MALDTARNESSRYGFWIHGKVHKRDEEDSGLSIPPEVGESTSQTGQANPYKSPVSDSIKTFRLSPLSGSSLPIQEAHSEALLHQALNTASVRAQLAPTERYSRGIYGENTRRLASWNGGTSHPRGGEDRRDGRLG